MQNFYDLDGSSFFDPQKYFLEWKKLIGIESNDEQTNKRKIQSLGSHAQNLWKNFNEDRSELDKHYMETSAGLLAYVASFLTSNVERIFGLLSKNENLNALEHFLWEDKEELVVADFGAGPLSATVGLLCTLEFLFSKNRQLKKPQKIIVYAVDRSEKIVTMGRSLIEKSLLNSSCVSFHYVTSAVKIEKKIDITLCSNVFNEIPQKHHLKTALSIYERMNESSLLLILEPGQELHAKALGTLRDDLIEKTQDCSIVSPCAHKKPCPMSSKSKRSDWCWFRHYWNPPAEQKTIDKLTKIDHTVLNYSYVFFYKGNTLPPEFNFYARVVSNPFPASKESDLNKILLCTNEGEIENILTEAHFGPTYQRGDRLNNPI